MSLDYDPVRRVRDSVNTGSTTRERGRRHRSGTPVSPPVRVLSCDRRGDSAGGGRTVTAREDPVNRTITLTQSSINEEEEGEGTVFGGGGGGSCLLWRDSCLLCRRFVGFY